MLGNAGIVVEHLQGPIIGDDRPYEFMQIVDDDSIGDLSFSFLDDWTTGTQCSRRTR